jgi:uncharacterized protein (TIGR01777 family)
MKIAITGASGMVGAALTSRLGNSGHEILAIGRSAKQDAHHLPWDPASGKLDRSRLEGLDAVIHLAGEGIANGRWTAARKAALRDSRVLSTQLLCESLAALSRPPAVLVSASAVGFYGSRGDEILDEGSAMGEGFLPGVCRDWEAETSHAQRAGIRVVQIRIALVLSRHGGALAKMLLPFRLGLGGRLGDGRQWMSWIALHDLVRVIEHAIADENLAGPINAAAPQAVTNAEFTKALGAAVSRPTIFPLPAFVIRLLFGEMGERLLLEGQRVRPRRLLDAGFVFEAPTLERGLALALA